MPDSTPNNLSAGSQSEGRKYSISEQEQLRRESEYRRVKKELATHKPLTRRQLSKITGIEIASLCGRLHELQHIYKSVVIPFTAKCETTGKRVYHYTLASKVSGQKGADDGQPK